MLDHQVIFTLTPALSLKERGGKRNALHGREREKSVDSLCILFPLPSGERVWGRPRGIRVKLFRRTP